MPTSTVTSAAHQKVVVGRLQWAFRVILLFWLVCPFVLLGTASNDGSAFITAPKIMWSDTETVYAVKWFHHPDLIAPVGRPDIWDRWLVHYCDNEPTHDCETNQASFLSAPPTLLVYLPASLFGATGAILIIRLVAAVLLVASMERLWRTLVPDRERMAQMFVLCAALMTPAVVNVMVVGQNGPVLVLSACLGVTAVSRTRWGAIGAGAVLAAAIGLKLFPVMLLGALVLLRKWRLLGATIGVGVAWVALSYLVLPHSLWPSFFETFNIARVGVIDFPYNRSIDSAMQATLLPDLRFGTFTTAALLVRALALFALWWTRVRKLDEDFQWAWFWLAALLCTDYVWPNYFLLYVPAAVFIVRRQREASYLLPIAGATSMVVLATWTSPGVGHVIAAAILLAGTFGLPFLAQPIDQDEQPAVAPVGAST